MTLSNLTRLASRLKDDAPALVALELMVHGIPVTTKKEVCHPLSPHVTTNKEVRCHMAQLLWQTTWRTNHPLQGPPLQGGERGEAVV